MHPKGAGVDVVEFDCWGFDAFITLMGMGHVANIACCVWLTRNRFVLGESSLALHGLSP